MSAFEIAKEIVRITSTAGLSKEVIGLLEKKLAILTGEVADLTTKVSKLEMENGQLRAQLHDLQPVGFQESMGVLWKRTPTGFEPHAYCKECVRPSVMSPMHEAGLLVCSNGHHAPISVRPPLA
jgi:hypothetical protein